MTVTLPTTPVRILHLEDSLIDHQLVYRALTQSGLRFSLVRVETLQDLLLATQHSHFDVVLADYRLQGFTAVDAWQALSQLKECPPFVLLSGAIGESAAVASIKLGMSDYLLKDDIGKLARVIERSIEVHQARIAKEQSALELVASERRLSDFAEYLQLGIEHERAAIAREIHDDIGGSLAAIKFDLAWIGRHSTDSPTIGHVNSALEMLHHAIGASQRIMMNLRPAILDQGLAAALDWLAAGFERRTGIPTRLRTTQKNVDLTKAIELTAYRTAQEALTNISKYAGCQLVTIELSDAESVLTLEITDDGCGISDTDKDKPKAFGLRGLRERAKTVGGWLDISTQKGRGTSIILSVPLANRLPTESHESFQ